MKYCAGPLSLDAMGKHDRDILTPINTEGVRSPESHAKKNKTRIHLQQRDDVSELSSRGTDVS